MTMFGVEVRRALHRRAVHVLIGLALGFTILAAVIAVLTSAGKPDAWLLDPWNAHPAAMVHWWNGPDADGILMLAAIFLFMGGLIGGASVVGAEWKAGTITTSLTWEPRRRRLHLARIGACAVCAFVIAVALQVVFLAALSISVVLHGTTAHVDAAWWGGLVLVVLRIATLTALAAALGASLATIGRNTAFGILAVFAWMAVIENVLRGLRPASAPHLIGENLSIALTWDQLDGVDFARSPGTAAAAVAIYCLAIAVVGLVSFERRDIAGVS